MELRVQEAGEVELDMSVTAVGGQVTVKPVVGLTPEPRTTVPAKLNVLVRVTETAAPDAPGLKFTGPPTEIVKSPICAIELAEWDAVPGEPAPVMVTR